MNEKQVRIVTAIAIVGILVWMIILLIPVSKAIRSSTWHSVTIITHDGKTELKAYTGNSKADWLKVDSVFVSEAAANAEMRKHVLRGQISPAPDSLTTVTTVKPYSNDSSVTITRYYTINK